MESDQPFGLGRRRNGWLRSSYPMPASADKDGSWFDPAPQEPSWVEPTANERGLARALLPQLDSAGELDLAPEDGALARNTVERLDRGDRRVLEIGARSTDATLRDAAERVLALRLARARSRGLGERNVVPPGPAASAEPYTSVRFDPVSQPSNWDAIVAEGLANGMTVAEIAERQNVSAATLHARLNRLYDAWRVYSEIEFVDEARRRGVIRT